ncbi:hypothetical protein CTI12_AA074270 [Artemisia annua]|uniref:Protein KAKU4 n=1 Tax=Artemisia annua TaxID=35608 RepID=A0A2U1Q585_ARTAN|nr:hypothetical protein CTI12_AA074270 [Artemisia annua]
MTDTGRSGGKILKYRRTTTRTTPYDRPITPTPPPPPPPQPDNPNWLTAPAKFVAGGASKILSSFWNPMTWANSSSSEEEEESDSGSEDESGDDENPSDAVDELNQQQQESLSQKSQTLHLIEQLLMLEQFSREESDRLIEIIKSRVLDYSMREGGDAGPSTIRHSTYDETPDIRSQAIMEAKKWVEENKVKSGLKSNLDNGFYALKSVVTPQATEGDAGSPIDVAKSYMKARPPWASPISHDNSPTPSPLAADLFKERTPTPNFGGGTSFSSAKRDYLSAGSWNIQEEIRRVRTKATEDMLSSHRSMKHAPSTFEYNTRKFSLLNDKFVVVGRDEAINFGTPKCANEIVTLDSDEGTPGLSDMRAAQDDLPTEMSGREQYQGNHSDNKQTTRNSSDGNGLEKEDNNKKVNDLVEKNCYLMTESLDIPPINYSQGSSNNDDHSLATKIDDPSENRAVTRAGRNTRRGKGRGK